VKCKSQRENHESKVEKLGQKDDAIPQFTELLKFHPNNPGVKRELERLR